jgi:hypothetical protein
MLARVLGSPQPALAAPSVVRAANVPASSCVARRAAPNLPLEYLPTVNASRADDIRWRKFLRDIFKAAHCGATASMRSCFFYELVEQEVLQ